MNKKHNVSIHRCCAMYMSETQTDRPNLTHPSRANQKHKAHIAAKNDKTKTYVHRETGHVTPLNKDLYCFPKGISEFTGKIQVQMVRGLPLSSGVWFSTGSGTIQTM